MRNFKILCFICVFSSVYADDAQTTCHDIAGGIAFRQDAHLTNYCNSFFSKLCQQTLPIGTTGSCGVTFYGSKPADTVLQCSAAPAYGPSFPTFKYVLCQQKNNQQRYWAIMLSQTSVPLPKQVNQ